MSPRLVIDARMVGALPHGFGRYTSLLVQGLRDLAAERGLPYEPLFLTGEETPQEIFGGFETLRLGSRFLSPLELVEIPAVLRRLKADAYHSPTFSSLFSMGPLRSPCPWIVTIHDSNHLTYGSAAQKLYYRKLLAPFARGATEVLTVSEFSRAEFSEWSGVAAEDIEVVANALSPEYMRQPSESELNETLGRYGLERGRYFLCISNPKPHKNVATLLQAHAACTKEISPWPLVLTQSPVASPHAGVKVIGGVVDSDARSLMAGAGAVVFPSLYEGFGLPPVEGAALGAPLIVSDIAPHREGLVDLKSDEVVWIDPRDLSRWATELRSAVQGALRAPSLESRSRLIHRFSVQRLAAHMDRIYRRVLGMSS